MKIQLSAVVLSVNWKIKEALVKFNTNKTLVVKIDVLLTVTKYDRRLVCPGASVFVEFDSKDEFLTGEIVFVCTEDAKL